MVKLREKRQTLTDAKNEYQSVAQNNSSAIASTTTTSTPTSMPTSKGSSVVVHMGDIPLNSEKPLVGVNGTGQRKEIDGKQQKQYPKKVVGASLPQSTSSGERLALPSQEEFLNNIDVKDDDEINNIKNQNFTVNLTTEEHKYYNSTMYINKAEADAMWTLYKNITHNSMLSQSHRRAMVYGQIIHFRI